MGCDDRVLLVAADVKVLAGLARHRRLVRLGRGSSSGAWVGGTGIHGTHAQSGHSGRVTLRRRRRLARTEGLRTRPSLGPDQAVTTARRSTTVRATVAAMMVVALTACGGVDGGDSETKVPTDTSSTTMSISPTQPNKTVTTAAAASCADLGAKALRLAQDARATMRGIRGPTPEEEAKLRAREQALRAEARRLGCPVPPALSSDYVREPAP